MMTRKGSTSFSATSHISTFISYKSMFKLKLFVLSTYRNKDNDTDKDKQFYNNALV